MFFDVLGQAFFLITILHSYGPIFHGLLGTILDILVLAKEQLLISFHYEYLGKDQSLVALFLLNIFIEAFGFHLVLKGLAVDVIFILICLIVRDEPIIVRVTLLFEQEFGLDVILEFYDTFKLL